MATAKKTTEDKPETTPPTSVLTEAFDKLPTPEQTDDISKGDTAEAAAAKQRAEEAAKINKETAVEDKAAEERSRVAEESGKAVEEGKLPHAVTSDHFTLLATDHFGIPVVEIALANNVGPAPIRFALSYKDELIAALRKL